MKNLKEKSINGVKWTTVSTIVLAVISIVKLSVLSRYLESEDFGLMAIVSVFIGFSTLFMDLGLNTAILHFQDIKRKEYYSLFWLNFVLSFLLYFILFISAPFIASFYENAELVPLLNIMGIGLIFSAFGKQFKTQERKSLKFKFISIVDIVSGILSLALSIILAVKGYGVYALVYAILAQFLISNLILFFYGLNIYGMKFHFRFSESRRFLKVGMYQTGGQILNYFNRDLDTLLIGKLLGAEILGGYNLAKQLVFRPASIINPILTMVGGPSLAIIQDDKTALKKNYLKLVSMISSLNFLAYSFILIFAPFIVKILYGQDFYYIYPLVQVLCVYMFLRSSYNPVGSLVIASGRTDLEFIWNVLNILIMPFFIVAGSYYGVVGVAVSLSVYMIFMIYPFWKLLIQKMIAIRFIEYLSVFKMRFYGIYKEINLRKN